MYSVKSYSVNMFRLVTIALIILNTNQSVALTVFDPQNFVQNYRTAIRELEQIENQIQQIANQIELIKRFDQDLLPLDSSIANELQDRYGQIQSLLGKAQGLAYNVKATEEKFQQLYPENYREALTTNDILQNTRTQWQEQHRAFQHALTLQSQVLENIAQDQTTLQNTLKASEQAQGSLQALQAGNQILGLSVQQLMQLQTLITLSERSTILQNAKASSSERMAQDNWKRMMGDPQD
ncbi:MAG: P-type conjugative transfer protein TrbJ [Pseudomonadota bacterium]